MTDAISHVTMSTMTFITEHDDQSNLTDTGLFINVTDPWPGSHGLDYNCDISTKYGIISSIIAAICCIFGVLYTYFGYRFFKAIMFLTGFIFGTVIVFVIIAEQQVLPAEGTLGCAVGAGILVGLLTMLLQHIGLFLTGLNLGLAIAVLILVIVEQFIHPPTKWIPVGVFLMLGTICGIISLKCQKSLTIIGTSVFGAAMGLAGIDYFVEQSRMALYVWDRVKAEMSSWLCLFSWVMFAVWPAIAMSGIIIQWKITSSGYDHRHTRQSQGDLGSDPNHSQVHERIETQQTRYRHLYQARRVKGDVIAQNFIQNIHQKMQPAIHSLTALSSEPSNDEESTATTTLTHAYDHGGHCNTSTSI